MEYKKNRVLLIYPAADVQDMILLPLSLLYVAQPLIENGIDVEIIDQRFEKDFFETLGQRLKPEPICIGINCITGPQIEQVIPIVLAVVMAFSSAICTASLRSSKIWESFWLSLSVPRIS